MNGIKDANDEKIASELEYFVNCNTC